MNKFIIVIFLILLSGNLWGQSLISDSTLLFTRVIKEMQQRNDSERQYILKMLDRIIKGGKIESYPKYLKKLERKKK